MSAVGDFQLLVTPPDQLLPPGGSVSFLVQVGSVGGFADEVTLTVGDLPDGVTFQLSDDTVTPPASVHLTLIASEDADVGSFPIVVTGIGGGITHQATGSVTVDFGLVPVCYARVEGTITDRETGLPIANAQIVNFPNLETDAQGHYSFDEVGLGENNAPSTFSLLAMKAGYWRVSSEPADFVCDQLTRVDFTLLPMIGAAAHGTVVEGTVDPNDPEVVTPGATPIEGIHVAFEVVLIPGQVSDQTDADGAYAIDLDHLGTDNTPMQLSLSAREGVNFDQEVYWPRHGSTPSPILLGDVSPGDDVAVPPIGLVRKCFGSVSGTLVYGDTQQPAAGVTVTAWHFWYSASEVTDANGAYDIPVVALGYNNQPTDVYLSASEASAFYSFAQGQTHFDACGDDNVVPLELPPVLFGSLQGRVTDVETGLALPGAQVAPRFISCPTCEPNPGVANPSGDYRIDRIPALAAPDFSGYAIEANHTGYWWEIDGIELSAGDVETRDFALLRKKFASLSGTVTDSITGLPIEGATGGAHHAVGTVLTDAQGRYSQSNLDIGYRNVPLEGAVTFGAPGYWSAQVPATFEADRETIATFELIPICEGATIRGRVVDATNQQPLEHAVVTVIGNSSDLTGPDGRYEISGVQVGLNNSPISVQMFASKEGYFTQSKTITVFCGASISINFGPPPPSGALEGFVTNGVTGDPIANVLIVGEFGEETRTDADGYYLFEEVPVNDDGSLKTWSVTALPSDFPLQTKSITIRAGETARLDFQFGAVQPPPTGRIVVKVVTQPIGSSQSFSFTPSYGSPFSLTDGQSNDSGALEAGKTYSISQTAVPGWDTTVGCDQGATPASIVLAADTTVTCTFTNAQAGLNVVKSSTTTSITAVGQVVPYTFTLINTGNVTLSGITVTDPNCDTAPAYQSGDTNSDGKLDLNETWTYTCSHTVTQAEINAGGDLENTVTADSDQTGPDTDDYGIPIIQTLTIDIEKATNGEDADTPTGPTINVGDSVIWTYIVTNTGNVTLSNISVTDNQLANSAISCPTSGNYTIASLAPGASETCRASGTAVAGQYSNIGTATSGQTTASDPSHYFGHQPVTGGCTPGFWQGGKGSQLWNTKKDKDWKGYLAQPFFHGTEFNKFFTKHTALNKRTMIQIVSNGATSVRAQKAARSLVAAYLNTSWAPGYPQTQAQLKSMWTNAVNSGDAALNELHQLVDTANNAFGGCHTSQTGSGGLHTDWHLAQVLAADLG